MEDTPLHPDTDLVADILGQRPDVYVTSEAMPKTTRTTAAWNNPLELGKSPNFYYSTSAILLAFTFKMSLHVEDF